MEANPMMLEKAKARTGVWPPIAPKENAVPRARDGQKPYRAIAPSVAFGAGKRKRIPSPEARPKQAPIAICQNR